MVRLVQALLALTSTLFAMSLGFTVFWWLRTNDWADQASGTIHANFAAAFGELAVDARSNMHRWMWIDLGTATLIIVLALLLRAANRLHNRRLDEQAARKHDNNPE